MATGGGEVEKARGANFWGQRRLKNFSFNF